MSEPMSETVIREIYKEPDYIVSWWSGQLSIWEASKNP